MPLSTLTHAEFPQKLAASPKLVVKFTASWCGPCRSFAPTVQAAADKHSDIEFVEVDIDKEPHLAAQWRVRSIPFLMGFKEGQVAFQVLGAVPGSELEKNLQRL